MAFRIHWEQQGILLERTGAETFEIYQEIIADLTQDARYDAIRYVLCDIRNAACGDEATFYEINEILATFMSRLFSERSFAIANVVSDLASAVSSKHYATLATHPFAIFTNMAEARNWVQTYLEKS
ncbi:MAG: hypothetical protein VB032_04250 [Burkholderiaceae bacterium]|nr:hypothetical protein [Burkholderiaceae bacterium]